MKKIYLLFALTFLTVFGYSQSIFLEISGVAGDAPEGQPVYAYSWGVSNSGSAHVGGGMGAGKANVQDLSLTMMAGKPSMALLESVTLGKHFPKVKLKIIDNKKVVYSITLEDVMVTSYQTGASCGNNKCEKPAESISLTFAKVIVEDFSNNTSYGYDVASNSQN